MRMRRLPESADARGQRAGLRRAGHLMRELGVSGGSGYTFQVEQTPAVSRGDVATGCGCHSEGGLSLFAMATAIVRDPSVLDWVCVCRTPPPHNGCAPSASPCAPATGS